MFPEVTHQFCDCQYMAWGWGEEGSLFALIKFLECLVLKVWAGKWILAMSSLFCCTKRPGRETYTEAVLAISQHGAESPANEPCGCISKDSYASLWLWASYSNARSAGSGRTVAISVLTFSNWPHSHANTKKNKLNKYLFTGFYLVFNSANETWSFLKSTPWVIKTSYQCWACAVITCAVVLGST